jgi:hypothetical protein
MRMTVSDIVQCTSESVAKPRTSVLIAPARPAHAADMTNTSSFEMIDDVTERNGARLVLFQRAENAADERERRRTDPGP